jgi:seryl-tRNA synthetase
MLDIQFIRDNRELVQEKSKQKGYDVDLEQLLGFDNKRRELLIQVEDLRRRRNELSENAKGQRPSEEQITEGRRVKEELANLEHQFSSVEQEFNTLLKTVPNLAHDHVPVGASEQENVVTKEWGEKPHFDFEPKPHWVLAEMHDLVDKERAAKISGSRFAYLKGGLVRLQFALVQFVMDTLGDEQTLRRLIDENGLQLSSKPFTPVLPPAMLRTEPYEASARLNAEEVTYKLADDDLWLNASAEHTLCTMYWNEILPADQLPVRYLGYSTSFRREAGTYGKDTEGIIRLHQFDKLEMEVFGSAETGLDEHKLLIAIQEYLIQQLRIPYRYVQKCTFDIGKPNASGVDLDCWFPGQNRYIETHTADYMTDYQARDLKTRARKQNGEVELVHTNDATAFAMSRILAAIMENNQTQDGRIWVPDVLRPYMGGREWV